MNVVEQEISAHVRGHAMTALHLSTIFPRSPSSLQSYITKLSKVYSGHGHTFIFALSANSEAPSDLAKSVQSLTNFIGDGGQTVGCLSSPFNGVNSRALSCSFGVFESPATTFRSVIPGKAEVQVGRWHSFRKKEEQGGSTITEGDYEEGVVWEDVWDRSKQATSLPEDLQKLECVGPLLATSKHRSQVLAAATQSTL